MLARVVLVLAAMSGPAAASETVHLFAAGSLRAALTEVGAAFERASGHRIEARYGPSGVLKDEIAGGAKADVFASANVQHPAALARAGRGIPVVPFARNRLCALARPGLTITSASLLDVLLDPNVKVGTSTPKADPSGDSAFEMFGKAEALKPGARATLERKALQLTGAPSSAASPAGRSAYGWHVAEGRADVFITYCTNALAARKENAGQQIVALPDPLAVGADYGLTVMIDAPAVAYRLALFILSAEGQDVLTRHGFAAPTLSQ